MSEEQIPGLSLTGHLVPTQLGWDELVGATNAERWLQNPCLKHHLMDMCFLLEKGTDASKCLRRMVQYVLVEAKATDGGSLGCREVANIYVEDWDW